MSAAQARSEQDPLILERQLSAPPQAVWRAWTEPQALMRWFGPHGSEVLDAELDLRVGGAWRLALRAADGEEHRVAGVYREVVAPARLVFTWAWQSTPERESLVELDLAPSAAGTHLVLRHSRFADAAALASHRAGWTSSLERLAAACTTPETKR